MEAEIIKKTGRLLFDSMNNRQTINQLTNQYDDITIEDAYQISLAFLQHRLDAGERVIGKKIGCTSAAVQNMLGVYQPDFGYLTDGMAYSQGQEMPISEKLIQPLAEGEIAFVLKKDLKGPGITTADVISATDFVIPCFEIVDSRFNDFKLKIQDTVADNASCGLFVLGDKGAKLSDVDLRTCGMVVEKNGKIVSTGAGAAALGSPLNCVAWLANTLGRFGIPLKAGEVILSGALVPLEKVAPGDSMKVSIGGIGEASVLFT